MEGDNGTGTGDGSDQSPSYSAFTILLLVFIIILANIVLMVGVRRSSQCQRLFYTMLLSLATVDILWACLVLTLPAFLLVYGDFWLVTGVCAVWHVLEPLLQAVSLLHVVMLAYNSHMALVHPLRYRVASEGCRWLVLQEMLVWVGACVLLIPMLVVLLLAPGGVTANVQWARECRTSSAEREVVLTRAVCVLVPCIGAGIACVLSGLATRRHKHVLHTVCSIMQKDPASSTVICNGTQIVRNITRLHAVAATFKARPLKHALSNGSTTSVGKDSIGSAHSIEASSTPENSNNKEMDAQSVCRSISTNSSCSTFPIEPTAQQDSLPEGASPSGSQDGIVMELDSNNIQNSADNTMEQSDHLQQEENEEDHTELDKPHTNIEEADNNHKETDNQQHDVGNTDGEHQNNHESPDTAQSPLEDAEPFALKPDKPITDVEEVVDKNENITSDPSNPEETIDKQGEESNSENSEEQFMDAKQKEQPNVDQPDDSYTANTEQLTNEDDKLVQSKVDEPERTDNEPNAQFSVQNPANSENDNNELVADNSTLSPENTISQGVENISPVSQDTGNHITPPLDNPASQNAEDLTPSSQATKPPPFSRVSRESLNEPIEDKDIDPIIGNGVLNPCFISGDEEEGISLADAIQVHSPSLRSTVDDNQERPNVEKDQSIDSLDTDAAECGIRPGRRSILKRDNHRSLRKSVKFASDVNESTGVKKLVRKGTKHVKVTHSQSNGIPPTTTMTFSTLSLQKSLSVTPESQSSLDYLSKVNSVQGERATNRLRNEERTFWVVCAMLISFIVLYVPYTIAFTLHAFSADPQESIAITVLQWISYCSGLVLPGVMLVISKEIRDHMSAACCCIPTKYSEESHEPQSTVPENTPGSKKPVVDEEAVEVNAPDEQLKPIDYQLNHDHTVLDNNLLAASLQSAIDRLNAEKNENDDDSSSVSTTAMVHNDAALDDLYFEDGSEQLDATEMTRLPTDHDGSMQNFMDGDEIENHSHEHNISMEYRTDMNGQTK